MPFVCSYGARPSPFDPRDYKYARVTAPHVRRSHASVFREKEVILNQADEGSCVINTFAEMIEFFIPGFWGSRSFGYYKTRVLQRDVHEDEGCDPRTALKAIKRAGMPPETRWPYDGLPAEQSKYFAKPPPTRINVEARKLVLGDYQALGQTAGLLNDICDAIDSRKVPVAICIAIYESFESGPALRTGKIPVPGPNERLLGWHEVEAGAYDDRAKLIKFRNHWDYDYGDGGYGYLPYEFASNPRLLTDANIILGATLTP